MMCIGIDGRLYDTTDIYRTNNSIYTTTLKFNYNNAAFKSSKNTMMGKVVVSVIFRAGGETIVQRPLVSKAVNPNHLDDALPSVYVCVCVFVCVFVCVCLCVCVRACVCVCDVISGNFIHENKSTVFDCTNMSFLPATFRSRGILFRLDTASKCTMLVP